MSSSIDNLYTCTNPVRTAEVFNPTRPEYYLKDEVKAAQAEPAVAVNVTLSDAAKSALATSGQ